MPRNHTLTERDGGEERREGNRTARSLNRRATETGKMQEEEGGRGGGRGVRPTSDGISAVGWGGRVGSDGSSLNRGRERCPARGPLQRNEPHHPICPAGLLATGVRGPADGWGRRDLREADPGVSCVGLVWYILLLLVLERKLNNSAYLLC